MCVSITRYILNANKNKKEETYPGPRPQTKLNTVIYSRTKKTQSSMTHKLGMRLANK